MARSFNGSSDFIAIPLTDTQLQPPFSIALWIYPTTLQFGAFIGGASGGGGVEFRLDSAGTMTLLKEVTAGYLTSTGHLTVNAWSHVLAVVSSSVINFYINGVFDSTASGSFTFNTGANTHRIGNGSASGDFFPGRIADFAIWNVLLSATEAKGLGTGIRVNRIRPLNFLAWLPLDGTASTEPDLSGKAISGTLTGTTKAFGPPFTLVSPRPARFEAFVAPTPPAFILMPQIVT
jgi:hypothetical protein